MKKTLAIILSVMMILSTVSFAAPVMTGTVANAGEVAENVAMETENDDVAELTLADEWTHETYGDLLYEMTFETGHNFLKGAAISYYGRVNPNYPGSDKWTTTVASDDDKNPVIAAEGNNHFLTFKNGTSQWPQFQTNAEKTFAGVGIYTLVADVKYTPGTTSAGVKFGSYIFNSRYQYNIPGTTTPMRDGNNSSQVGVGTLTYETDIKDGEWKTSIGTLRNEKVSANNYPVDGLYQILHTFSYSGKPTTKSVDTFAIDNVKMYYKPFTAEVTVLGGENTVAGDQIIKVPLAYNTNNVRNKADLMALVLDHGDKILVDLTLSDGTPFETVDIMANKTLKAVWKDYTVSKGLSLDFNTDEEIAQFKYMSGGQIDSNPVNPAEGNVAGSGYKNANTMVNNGTYVTAKYAVNGPDGNPVSTGIYDSNYTTSKLQGGTKSGISDIGALQIRMRVRNYSNEKATFKYRKNDKENVSIQYSPDMRLDLFFDVDVGDGKTFTGLTGQRQAVIYSGKTYDQLGSDWFTVYCDLTKLTGKKYDASTKKFIDDTTTNFWSDASLINCLRIDPSDNLWTGTEIDIDYIHFIQREDIETYDAEVYFLNDGVKTAINGNMTDIDYRYNSVLCYEFEEELGITADELYAQLVAGGMTDGVFNAAAEYDEETCTYTFYAGKSLVGKSVNLAPGVVKINGEVAKISADANGVKLTYAAKKAFDDGENLIPNGEFTVPYYNSFDIMHTGAYETRLDADETRLYVKYAKATENGFSTVRNNAIQFKPNTNYFVQVGYQVVGYVDENGNVDNSYTFDKTVTNFWMPRDDSKFNLTKPEWYGVASAYPYIKEGTLDTEQYGMFSLKSNFIGQPQTRSRVFTLNEDTVDTSYISFQGDLRGAGSKDGDVLLSKKNEDGTTTNLVTVVDKDGNGTLVVKEDERDNIKGVTYFIDHLIVKEMFDINFVDADSNVLETRISAKDMSIYLPEEATVADGSKVIGWTDGEVTYDLGALYTLETAGDKTLTAVIADGTSLKPTSYDVASIRVADPMGIRFKASVTKVQKENADEYGYVVARKVALTTAGVESADFTLDTDVKKVTGAAYVKNSIDKIYAIENDNVFFTAVIYNIPESNYEDVLVIRPYIKSGDLVVYGDAVERSVYQVACAIKDGGYNGLDEHAKQKVDAIIEVVEG